MFYLVLMAQVVVVVVVVGGGFGAEGGIDVDRKARTVGSRSRRGPVEGC